MQEQRNLCHRYPKWRSRRHKPNRNHLDIPHRMCYDFTIVCLCPHSAAERTGLERSIMNRIETLETRNLCDSAKNGGCGECQTSCQSACKTSCGIANQKCESENK